VRSLTGFSFVVLSGLALAADSVYSIDTVAGSSWVGDGGPGASAIVLQAEGLAADGAGNLYIADAGDQRVRKVTPDGVIHTIAGTGVRGFSGDGGPATSAQLNSPYGLACDAKGNLYIADLGNARIRKVTPDGTINTIAGGGVPALSAPRNLALDSIGNLYISDFTGHRVYRLGTDGTLVAAVGTGVSGFSGDGGAAAQAQLSFPAGLAFDLQGSLWIADSGNHTIRRVMQGQISSAAKALTPTGLAFDSLGALYVADPAAARVTKMPVTGPPTAVLNAAAQDVVFSPDGNLYASVAGTVLRVDAAGAVTTRAGGGSLASGDSGSATQARLNHPSGVAMDSSGNLYIADRDNNRMRRVSPDGTITTVAGTGVSGNLGDGGLASQAQLNAPSSVSVDAAGSLYIADTGNQRIRKVTTDGRISAATNLGLLSPVYAIPDSSGNIYIADAKAGKILKASSNNGVPATVLSGLASPRGLALDQLGNLYFTEAGNARVSRLSPGGSVVSLGGKWGIPRGVAVDSAGNVFVADTGLQQVLQIDTSGNAAPIAGTGTAGFSGDGGPALSGQLGFPWDVSVTNSGTLLVADLDNNRVRSLSTSALAVSSLVVVDAVNAASLSPGPIAPGTLVLLRNAPANTTQVMFGSTAGQILSAGSSGVLVVAPQQIAGLANVTINILSQQTSIASIPVTVANSAPALFADPSGQAAVTNQDGTVNSQGNPAARGSVLSLYGTGLGTAASASVTMEGYSAQVLYAGPAAGYPGLFQINAQVPGGFLPPGDRMVIVTAGQSSSQADVAVWID
jgi:uncharacterized protein (TIGR03437 family)